MKKTGVLAALALSLLAATYSSTFTNQKWKFDNPSVLDQMEPLSGKWEIVTPPKLNLPLLVQSVKYADFPKVLLKDNNYFDFDISTKMYISNENKDTQSGGLILRYRNLYSFYMLFLNSKDKRMTLTKASLGGFKVVKRVNSEFQPDRWYELKAECYLNHIKGYVDGQQILEADDDTSTGGKIGLVTAGTSRIYFDGMQINAQKIDIKK